MRHKRNRYIISILITLLSVSVISCSENLLIGENPILPKAIIVSPMWPQSGFNAQNTSSPYAPYSHCNAVNLGEVDWFYDFGGYNSDGAEFCVDSKNNIYFLWQGHPWHKIYKFRHDGTVIWIKDSVYSDNFASFSLSPDEKNIYMNNGTRLICVDSTGHLQWTSQYSGYYTKPAIGKEGTIYTKNSNDIAAINPDGTLKWTTFAGLSSISVTKVALDRDENIYIAEKKIIKFDKDGNFIWAFSPDEQDFLGETVVIDGFGNLYFVTAKHWPANNIYSLTKDGVFRWKLTSGAFSSPVIGFDNKIYSVGVSVYCIDTSGVILWTKPMPQGISVGEAPVMDFEENLYFLSYDNGINAISVNKNGDPRWTINLSLGGLLPGPSLMPMGRMLVAPKRAGKIACIK